MRRLLHKLLLPATLVIIVGLPVVFYTMMASKSADAAWYNDNWKYRKSVEISSHTSAETNVYISLSGANALNTSDTTKFQSDCGDLRFTTYGGDVLPYYIVSGCGTATTVVHIQFASFLAGGQTIYYYYGNPSAPNVLRAGLFAGELAGVAAGFEGREPETMKPAQACTGLML